MGFPVIVWAAIGLDVGPRLASVCSRLGVASYAVYIIHQPASFLFEACLNHLLKIDAGRISPYGFCVFVALLIPGCLVLDAVYDIPTRRWLTRRFVGRPGVPLRAAPAH